MRNVASWLVRKHGPQNPRIAAANQSAAIPSFFAKLRAPEGKHFIWFRQSDHWPHLAEREEYARVLQSIKRIEPQR